MKWNTQFFHHSFVNGTRAFPILVRTCDKSKILIMEGDDKKSEETKIEKKIDLVKKIPSPYDLHTSDNPGNLITQVQLKGENYDEWSKAMRTSLRARRKWGFVEGSIP
jgi:hypothetical protein